MADDMHGFVSNSHDEMIFKDDDAAIRDASMHLLKEVGYEASTQDFAKGMYMVETGNSKVMIGIGEVDDLGGMFLSEGADFFLF